MSEVSYLNLLSKVLTTGSSVEDRTGVGTFQTVIPETIVWDMAEGFPCLTTKTTFWKGAIAELLWMCRGSTNVRELSKILYNDPDKPNFWTPNYEKQAKDLGYTDGNLGPVYGAQLVSFSGVNQLLYVEQELKNTPESRRAVISMWNPGELRNMALPPCHYTSVFNIDSGKLHLTTLMRSNDLFLGAPFNYVFYAALLECYSVILDIPAGTYSHISVNSHVYKNQLEQVQEQISRTPSKLPKLVISEHGKELLKRNGVVAFFDLSLDDFSLEGYEPQATLTAPMAV